MDAYLECERTGRMKASPTDRFVDNRHLSANVADRPGADSHSPNINAPKRTGRVMTMGRKLTLDFFMAWQFRKGGADPKETKLDVHVHIWKRKLAGRPTLTGAWKFSETSCLAAMTLVEIRARSVPVPRDRSAALRSAELQTCRKLPAGEGRYSAGQGDRRGGNIARRRKN